MSEMMDFIEFIRETTRFLRDAQYLQITNMNVIYTKKIFYYNSITVLTQKRVTENQPKASEKLASHEKR